MSHVHIRTCTSRGREALAHVGGPRSNVEISLPVGLRTFGKPKCQLRRGCGLGLQTANRPYLASVRPLVSHADRRPFYRCATPQRPVERLRLFYRFLRERKKNAFLKNPRENSKRLFSSPLRCTHLPSTHTPPPHTPSSSEPSTHTPHTIHHTPHTTHHTPHPRYEG